MSPRGKGFVQEDMIKFSIPWLSTFYASLPSKISVVLELFCYLLTDACCLHDGFWKFLCCRDPTDIKRGFHSVFDNDIEQNINWWDELNLLPIIND